MAKDNSNLETDGMKLPAGGDTESVDMDQQQLGATSYSVFGSTIRDPEDPDPQKK